MQPTLSVAPLHPNRVKSASKHAGFVSVHGAREHNLRDVSVEIPRDALVVFTGVSGSGKSSLAFGTLYAEAQRRYLESVSPYARRLFDQMPVPDVDRTGYFLMLGANPLASNGSDGCSRRKRRS